MANTWALYQRSPSFVLGFHGTEKSLVDKVVAGKTAHLKKSEGKYEWLGHGVYFWENDPQRGLEWAKSGNTKKKSKVLEVVARLKQVVRSSRWDNPTVTVKTTCVRGSGENRAFNSVYADWPDVQIRDAVARASFGYVGIDADFTVLDKLGAQHGRYLNVTFSSGNKLTVRLDQGVTYWRVASPPQGTRRPSAWFDFTRPDI